MPLSKQTNSRKKIERDINKYIASFKNKNDFIIVDLIQKLPIERYVPLNYRAIEFPGPALQRAYLFQRLKGIKKQTQLQRYIKTHKDERKKLGLLKVPDQRTISNFFNHSIDHEARETLEFIVNKIEEISEKLGVILDTNILKPEKNKKKTKARNQFLQKQEKIKEICRLIKKQLAPFIDLNLKNNDLYKKNDFIDLLIHMGLTQDFAENGSKTNQFEIEKRVMFCPKCHILMHPTFLMLANGNLIRIFKCNKCGYKKRISPNADSLLHHLENYPNRAQLHEMFVKLFDTIWKMARKANLFTKHGPLVVAIDYTEWLFYGDGTAEMVVGKEPERGTSKCYKFATISIVEAGKRFTLLALPISLLDNKDTVLKKLLYYALNRIKIRRVLADRGFCDSTSIKIYNSFNLKYLTPLTHYPTVKDILEISPVPWVWPDFTIKDTTTNLVIVAGENNEGKKVKYTYATNEDYDRNDPNLAEKIFNQYGKRWGIETSYRVKKHSFRPKTTSKNYLIRLFYFMFSVLMYNLWILAWVIISLALYGIIKETPVVTSKFFGTVLYTIDPGG